MERPRHEIRNQENKLRASNWKFMTVFANWRPCLAFKDETSKHNTIQLWKIMIEKGNNTKFRGTLSNFNPPGKLKAGSFETNIWVFSFEVVALWQLAWCSYKLHSSMVALLMKNLRPIKQNLRVVLIFLLFRLDWSGDLFPNEHGAWLALHRCFHLKEKHVPLEE